MSSQVESASNDSGSGDVRGGREIAVTIPDGSPWFSIDNPSKRVNSILEDELAWRDSDAEYKDSYRSGAWDGKNRLYSTEQARAPIGLLDRAVEALESNGYSVSVTCHGDRSGRQIDPEWNFDHLLRQYQTNAIEAALANGGGIISLPTGAGKSVVAMNLIYNLNQQSIILVHTKELLYQWASRVEDVLGVDVGVIGDGAWEEGDVTVASIQTLLERGTDGLSGSYGIGIFDECHRTSAAEKFQDIGLNIDLQWRVGLSATPWRSVDGEELEIEAVVGGEAITVGAQQLIDDGYLAKPKFELIEVPDQRQEGANEDYQNAVKRCLEHAPNRNRAIAEKAAELAADDYQVLVTTNRITQGKIIEYALNDTDVDEALDSIVETDADPEYQKLQRSCIKDIGKIETDQTAAFLEGDDSKNTREETMERFKDGDIDILVTTILKEGADLPSISAIVLAEGRKSKTEKIQRIGRALRPKEGRNHAIIADVCDSTGGYLEDHFRHRMQAYREYYGKYGEIDLGSDREQAVRNYLDEYDVPVEECKITENPSGTVTIKLTGYLGSNDFSKFRRATQQAEGITYDGEVNKCDPEWVDALDA